MLISAALVSPCELTAGVGIWQLAPVSLLTNWYRLLGLRLVIIPSAECFLSTGRFACFELTTRATGLFTLSPMAQQAAWTKKLSVWRTCGGITIGLPKVLGGLAPPAGVPDQHKDLLYLHRTKGVSP